MKLQFAVSRASLIFQKRFPFAVAKTMITVEPVYVVPLDIKADQLSKHGVQRRIISVVKFLVFLIFFRFAVAIFDLVHDLDAMHGLP